VSESLAVPARFNGPRQSGNGGYSAGALAAFVEGAAAVSLRRPVPLDSELRVERGERGEAFAFDGEQLVAEAEPAPGFELELPESPGVEAARAAMAGYRGPLGSEFSTCFVCGREREDALGVFAGPVAGRELVASTWTPPAWTADESGRVRPEVVWAVLDCPTYFAAYLDQADPLPPAVLARLTGRLDAPVPVGEEHVVIAWPLGAEGRKQHAGSAVVSAAGQVLASAEALMIEPRQG
jgi:hypothetical protein